MQTRMTYLVIVIALSGSGQLLLGCGSSEPCTGPSCPQAGDDGKTSTGDFEGACCLNGKHYTCSTQAAFQLCAGSDPAACHEKCGVDITCHMACDEEALNAKHDPSQCSRDSAKDGECTTSTPMGCVGSHNGMACTYSTQCPSGHHCAKGKCYSDAVGNPCTYSTECDSGNCTDGCCRGTSSGNACTYSTQCGAGLHCTNGTCYSGAKGNPCTYSTECTSGNCTNGSCQ